MPIHLLTILLARVAHDMSAGKGAVRALSRYLSLHSGLFSCLVRVTALQCKRPGIFPAVKPTLFIPHRDVVVISVRMLSFGGTRGCNASDPDNLQHGSRCGSRWIITTRNSRCTPTADCGAPLS